jgi:hypothetical protein
VHVFGTSFYLLSFVFCLLSFVFCLLSFVLQVLKASKAFIASLFPGYGVFTIVSSSLILFVWPAQIRLIFVPLE